MRLDLFAQLGFGVDQKMVFKTKQQQVGLDPSLRVEQERIEARPRRQLLHIVACETVQQARPVAAAYHNPASRRKVYPGGAGAQRIVTLAHLSSLEDPPQIHRNQDDRKPGEERTCHQARTPRVVRRTINRAAANTCATSSSFMPNTMW